MIVELLSDSTEAVDRGEKMDIYAKINVQEYYLFDPWSKVFEGYRLLPGTQIWQRMEPDDQGWLACEQLGLRVGMIFGTYRDEPTEGLRWIDASGNALPTGEELAQQERRETERQRRQVQRQKVRAEQQEARADTLQAELEELKRKLEAMG